MLPCIFPLTSLFEKHGDPGSQLSRVGVLNLFHLCTLCIPSELFAYPLAIIFLFRVPTNIIICIALCHNFHTLELFEFTLELFAYPLGLKYPGLRNPALEHCIYINLPSLGLSGHLLVTIPYL